ncbi:MAG: nitronate monooxygenase [Candidatus Eisenbacteria bacterium]|nr:nitronate monooxygenase [Candidatus Eisenbacteria bacterium]
MSERLSDRFFARGREFLGVETPILCGAMTWVSEPNLVSAVANAGGFASLAGGNAPPEILRAQIEETLRLTDRPFGVNLITIAPNYGEHLAIVRDLGLPFVIFAGSFPREREVRVAKESGARVLAFASTHSIARRMLDFGVDGLILEGMEAGGHVGHVSLSVLLQQVLFEVERVPVFVAGGIGRGRMLAHLFLMGAAGVQLGTLFAVAEESIAHPAFKERFIRANARDAVSTPQYDSRLPVVAVRALRNKSTDDFGRLQLDLLRRMDAGEIGRVEAQERVEEFWVGALRRAVMDGDVDRGSLMAGQSVGLVDRVRPVREILKILIEETERELRRVRETLRAD